MLVHAAAGPYTVRFEKGALAGIAGTLTDTDHVLIDANVARLHARSLRGVLEHRSMLPIDVSESAKSLERFPAYVEHLVARGVRRSHALVAIGGGVTQDICCFLAATLLRGLPWRFYPTTLLAQADSCIGSKSSINVGRIKNILGTFTPPAEIVIDDDVLATLPHRDFLSGVGEMIKVHAIAGPEAFDELARDYAGILAGGAGLRRYIERSLEFKRHLIETDEFDRGPRNVMNYGHTFGHAIESATDFAVPHGLAVTLGMGVANRVSELLGLTTSAHRARMEPVLRANAGDVWTVHVPAAPFFEALFKDKKHHDGEVTFILPDADGRIGVRRLPNTPDLRDVCRRAFPNLV